MISDNDPVVYKYISTPKEMSALSCGAFVAGIIESILIASSFVIQQIWFICNSQHLLVLIRLERINILWEQHFWSK